MHWWFIQQLKSRKPEARIAAAEKLAVSGNPEAIEALAEAANDSEPLVRRAVTIALGAFQHDSVVIPLSGLLNDLAPEVREAAAAALGNVHAQCAQRPLIASLKDSSAEVRRAAAQSLQKLGWQPQNSEERALQAIATGRFMQAAQEGDNAFMPLLAALKSDSYQQRKASVEALSRLEDPRALRPLVGALKDPDSHVRVSVVEALSRLANPEAIDALVMALKDEFVPVRTAAAEVLGRIGGGKALVPLSVALRDKSWDVRRAAVEGLGRTEDPRAVEPLLPLLKDKDPDVRMTALRALTMLGDLRALPGLIVTLADEVRSIRDAALTTLHRMDPNWDSSDAAQMVITDLEAAHRSRDYWVRQAAADVLARIAASRSRCHEPEEAAATAAIASAPRTVQLLVGLLRDHDRDFRLAAAEALGRLGDARVAIALGTARQDIDGWVQVAANNAWEEIQRRVERK
ncbi:MAG: HEAT repeat domain-containing protein [Verrucomicrobia bacterium]|nr:HEAT repeat domain-containing protein [Verrucomicrobiota bacterium]MBI3867043.1 HEAT repeat domain-containing protein [Verrucomicrobiota bacterium]